MNSFLGELPPIRESPGREPTDDHAPQSLSKEPNVRAYEPEFIDPAL